MKSLDGAIFQQSGLMSIVLADSLTTIWQYTFRKTPLSEIIFPEKLAYLYVGTFNGCEYLSKVYSLNTTAPIDVYNKKELPSYVFDRIAENATLYVPSGSKQNYIDVGYANYSTSTTTSAFTGEKVTLGNNFKNIEEWHKAIDKMIWSFNQIAYEYPDDPHTIFFDKKWKRAEENGIQLMTIDKNNTIHFSDILEEERPSDEEQNAYRNKIQEGLNLFAKYFQDLWD